VNAFPDDITYIEAEVSWLRSRCRRLEAERQLRDAADHVDARTTVLGATTSTASQEQARRIPQLRSVEDTIRQEIDVRLAINRSVGPQLGLDVLVEAHELDQFERMILLVTTIGALGSDYMDVMSPVTLGYAHTPTLELVSVLLEQSLAERMRSRVALLPSGKLLATGLISVHVGSIADPAEIPGAGLAISAEGFSVVTGMPELMRECRPKRRNGCDA